MPKTCKTGKKKTKKNMTFLFLVYTHKDFAQTLQNFARLHLEALSGGGGGGGGGTQPPSPFPSPDQRSF